METMKVINSSPQQKHQIAAVIWLLLIWKLSSCSIYISGHNIKMFTKECNLSCSLVHYLYNQSPSERIYLNCLYQEFIIDILWTLAYIKNIRNGPGLTSVLIIVLLHLLELVHCRNPEAIRRRPCPLLCNHSK